MVSSVGFTINSALSPCPLKAMKYYYREHLSGYERIQREAKRSWGEIHGAPNGFEKFASRPFFEEALPRLEFELERPRALGLVSWHRMDLR